MYIFLILLCAVMFAEISYRRLDCGLFLFCALLPTYLIRFKIGFLPTTFLEVMMWIIFVVWILKIIKEKSSARIKKELGTWIVENKIISTSIFLFLLAATISIFTSINTRAALGEWKAFYVEPIIVFFILILSVREKKYVRAILIGLLLSGLVTALLAIYQHFTGWMVPHAFWANRDTYRVTAWYGFPNAVGLFLAPIFILALYVAKQSFGKSFMERKMQRQANAPEQNREMKSDRSSQILNHWMLCISVLSVPAYALAIWYAKSTGAIIGILGGVGLLLLFWKKTRWWTVGIGVAGIIGLILLPTTNPIKQELLLQDRSGQIRISMWKETIKFLKDNPIHGAGLASYSTKIAPYHKTVHGEGIEIFHHPHNIFLTMWVNLGLLGLVSFVGIIGSTVYTRYTQRAESNVFHYFAIAALATILIMGLVDSPYIKNDLSVLFWFVIMLLVIELKRFVPSDLADLQFDGDNPDMSKSIDKIIYKI